MHFFAEFMGVIHAIEYARGARFRRLWLECDSNLVCQAFSLLDHGLLEGVRENM